jgi:pimeloyl-ACP methyl ester carboxylesterase
MRELRRGDLVFDVIDVGPSDGPVVVLLHGFPQFADSFQSITPALVAAGYRCVAMDQRGYSPRARPRGIWAYRPAEIVADTMALIDAVSGSGARRVHYVGHDWGAVHGWTIAQQHPERLASFTSLSVPHPAAMVHGMGRGTQLFKSWYAMVFQLGWLPRRWMLGRNRRGRRGGPFGWFLANKGGMPAAAVARDVPRVAAGDTLRAAIAWYRAVVFQRGDTKAKLTVPTLFVWADNDICVARASGRDCERWLDGPHRIELIPGGTHWLLDVAPDRVAALVLDHLAAYPV